ncbi:MAG: ABC-2 transporter permease, partial [Anaeroplasmataceae bacterium]|nr:ABC-2 transporter permease [Anaeroplasmataceae bacterium]
LMIGIIYLSFSYNKKRISADMTYSLPVTKRELFVGKYLATLSVLASMAVIFMLICMIIFGVANMNGQFDWGFEYQSLGTQLQNFVLGCLIQIAITIPLFNFMLLFYYKANTVLDGIVFVGFGFALTFIVSQLILDWTHTNISMFPLIVYIDAPQCFLKRTFYGSMMRGSERPMFLLLFSIYIVLGYLLFLYFFWFSKRDCSIRTQGLSNGIFGYRVFLPLTAGLIPLLFKFGEFEVIWFVLVSVGLFIGYCIYHRSVKFNKESYIVFASTLGIDFIFLILWLCNI